MKAMIFAAGKGTRLKPITDSLPKALVKVGDKTLLQYQIEKLKQHNIRQIVINVHHFADQILDYLAENQYFGCEIHISDERDQLLETGGGLLHARDLFQPNEPILLCNVDILHNLDYTAFRAAFNQQPTLAHIVVSERTTQRYFLFDKQNILQGWENIATHQTKPQGFQPTPDQKMLAFSGIHLVAPDIFVHLQRYAQTIANPAFSLTDFYLWMVGKATVTAYVPTNYKMVDIGKIEQLEQIKTLDF